MNDEDQLAVRLSSLAAAEPGVATPGAGHLERLRARLAGTAQDEGILDVAYRSVDTPVGTLLLAATERGLVRVAYPSEGHDSVLQDLSDRVSPRVLRAPARLDPAARQLDDYFTDRRHAFDLRLDLRLSSGFRQTVLETLARIEYGHTASYGAVAALAGSPRAARAVGTACATNPLPIVIPCHRVVPANGAIGNYLAGPDIKRTLLTLEKHATDGPAAAIHTPAAIHTQAAIHTHWPADAPPGMDIA
jgi:methylated-DNA-[protein]-cysteine S-methyltransferase